MTNEAMDEDARGAFIAVIKAHQKGRNIEVERLLDIMMDSVPRYSGERAFEEQPTITETQQDKIERLTTAEQEVLLECATDLARMIKTSIKRHMS